ncbi:unnamed protein product [Candidula unifasciata]|uniref:Mitochondrial transcription rescue factor 1 C-terminal domain-containing protein n=1 Tax=Candidula unifasciata TaxID=100452 RepID=A0A8S3YLW5_9EUPU|nr:unnamed protein product [Candidula unifasciata]
MAGSIVRTFCVIKNLPTPTTGLLASQQTARSFHKHLTSPLTKSCCPCQVFCQRCAKSSTSVFSAGFSSYRGDGCINSLYVGKKDLLCETRNVSFRMGSKISQVRNKSKTTQQDTENEENDSDQDDALDDDDFDAPPQFKVQKITAASNRADAVISHALNISRNEFEEIFLKSALYLNGEKLLKKSVKMDTGDYADVVLEKTEDQLKVKRVKVLKIYSDKTSKDRMILKVRVWKTPFLLPKPEFKPHSSS